jgi:hypothetical protein
MLSSPDYPRSLNILHPLLLKEQRWNRKRQFFDLSAKMRGESSCQKEKKFSGVKKMYESFHAFGD